MFVGKAANPRCFKHVNQKAYQLLYYSQIGQTVKLLLTSIVPALRAGIIHNE